MASWFPLATPGSRPQPPASAPYDEFDPKSEWKDEPAANVLNIYLPGFVKDQIKVRFDRVTKTLNVIAERPGGNNRTIRVNKDYIIPGKSNLEDIRAKLEDQTLKITIAKEITSQVDPKLREPTKTSQEPSSTQKPRGKKSPTPLAAPSPPPPPPPHDPRREMAEGRDFPDPTVLMKKAKAEFIKDEDENETPTPSGKEDRRSVKTDDEEIGGKRKKSPKAKIWVPEERKELIPEKRISWKGPKVRGEYYSEQEMKMSNDIPGSEEEETLPDSSGEETDIHAAARKPIMDLTTRIKEDKHLIINVGVAALIIVALGFYISYKIGSSGEGDNDW